MVCQARLGSATNGQAGELEQAVAELRENPYDLATLYNDFAVKYRVCIRTPNQQPASKQNGELALASALRRINPSGIAQSRCCAERGPVRVASSRRSWHRAGVAAVSGDGGVGRLQ